jgi:hypothetical protein
MNTKIKLFVNIISKLCFLLLSILIFSSCGVTTVTRTAYLEDAQVQGQINPPPLHITSEPKGGTITFSPYVSINQNQGVSTHIDADTYDDKTVNASQSHPAGGLHINSIKDNLNTAVPFNKSNLNWDISQASAGANAELYFSENVSIVGSLNLSMGGNNSFTDGSVGLAYFSATDNSAFRLEGGLLFNSYRYDAYSYVVEKITNTFSGSTTNYYYYYDKGNSSSLDYYFTFTINSANKESLVNYFLQIGYFRQSILDYHPNGFDPGHYGLILPEIQVTNNTGLKSTIGYIGLYPGIYFKFASNLRCDLGARILYATNIDSYKVNVWPAVQFDITF